MFCYKLGVLLSGGGERGVPVKMCTGSARCNAKSFENRSKNKRCNNCEVELSESEL